MQGIEAKRKEKEVAQDPERGCNGWVESRGAKVEQSSASSKLSLLLDLEFLARRRS